MRGCHDTAACRANPGSNLTCRACQEGNQRRAAQRYRIVLHLGDMTMTLENRFHSLALAALFRDQLQERLGEGPELTVESG